jgi:hypothetical protein
VETIKKSNFNYRLLEAGGFPKIQLAFQPKNVVYGIEERI